MRPLCIAMLAALLALPTAGLAATVLTAGVIMLPSLSFAQALCTTHCWPNRTALRCCHPSEVWGPWLHELQQGEARAKAEEQRRREIAWQDQQRRQAAAQREEQRRADAARQAALRAERQAEWDRWLQQNQEVMAATIAHAVQWASTVLRWAAPVAAIVLALWLVSTLRHRYQLWRANRAMQRTKRSTRRIEAVTANLNRANAEATAFIEAESQLAYRRGRGL